MANLFSGRSPKDEFKDQFIPGASDVKVQDTFRELSGIVVLTQAQYTALAVKDPNIIYAVTP